MATAPTTATFSPNCDELMRAALQLAGLLPLGRNPNSAELSHARFFLDTFLKGARVHRSFSWQTRQSPGCDR